LATLKEITAPLTPAMWGHLVQNGVARAKDGEYSLDVAPLDSRIAEYLIAHPVETVTDLVQAGITANFIGHTICGLPMNDETLSIREPFKLTAADSLGVAIARRMGSGLDGNVNKLLNSEHGLWLVVTRSSGIRFYGATSDADLLNICFIKPQLDRSVSARVKATATALTAAHRMPSVAARFLASNDVQAASLAVARAHTYAAITAGMSPTQVAELEAQILEHTERYRAETQPKFKAIGEARAIITNDDGTLSYDAA
jgi:hypothetical protein